MRSYYTADGRRSICQLEARDAETVREAFRAAGQPFGRVAPMWWREDWRPAWRRGGGRPPARAESAGEARLRRCAGLILSTEEGFR